MKKTNKTKLKISLILHYFYQDSNCVKAFDHIRPTYDGIIHNISVTDDIRTLAVYEVVGEV